MRRLPPSAIVAVALLLTGLAGCADARDSTAEAVGKAGQLPDQVRFCLASTRALNAVESGAPDVARDAMEEAVTQAPDDLVNDVRDLADRIRLADESGSERLRDPELLADATALRDRVAELCDFSGSP